MPTLTINPQKEPELKDLADLCFTYAPDGAERLDECLRSCDLKIPVGRYHAILRGNEIHIYAIDQRIDKYDPHAAGAGYEVGLRDDGVSLTAASGRMETVVLHNNVLGPEFAKSDHALVTREDLPMLVELQEYRKLADSRAEDIDTVSRMTELLEKIQAFYSRKPADPRAASAKPKHARARP